MRKTLGVAVIVVLGAVGGASGVSPAEAATGETGSIIVTTTVKDGEAAASGFEYRISSAVCAVPPPTTATTDASGNVRFDNLPLADGDGQDCRYDITAVPRPGFDLNVDSARLTDVTAGTVETQVPDVNLVGSTGILSNPTREPETEPPSAGQTLEIQCLVGVGAAEMRAGRHPITNQCGLPVEDRSGLGYASAGLPRPVTVRGIEVGNLTHFNQTIERGFHSADLNVKLTFQDVSTGATEEVSANYQVHIEETNDGGVTESTCEFETDLNFEFTFAGVPTGRWACADQLTLTGAESEVVTVGGAIVNLELGFGHDVDGGTCGDPVRTVYTREQTDTELCLLASVEAERRVIPTSVSVVNAVAAASPSPSGTALPEIVEAPSPSGTALPEIFEAPSASRTALPELVDAPDQSALAVTGSSAQASALIAVCALLLAIAGAAALGVRRSHR